MTRNRIFAFGLSWLLLPLPSSLSWNQKEVEGAQKTAFASCWDENFKNYASRTIQGAVFASGDGRAKAFVRVEAQALGKDSDGDQACQNRSALFIAKSGAEHFDSVFEANGENGEQGNGIQLIDWSPDSSLLVADLITWRYFSEGWSHTILTYSTRTGAIKTKSLQTLFLAELHNDCGLEPDLKGFLRDGRVVVGVTPFNDEGGPPCEFKESLWAIDISNFEVAPIIRTEKIKHNGRFKAPN